jgi:hypothetical protein
MLDTLENGPEMGDATEEGPGSSSDVGRTLIISQLKEASVGLKNNWWRKRLEGFPHQVRSWLDTESRETERSGPDPGTWSLFQHHHISFSLELSLCMTVGMIVGLESVETIYQGSDLPFNILSVPAERSQASSSCLRTTSRTSALPPAFVVISTSGRAFHGYGHSPATPGSRGSPLPLVSLVHPWPPIHLAFKYLRLSCSSHSTFHLHIPDPFCSHSFALSSVLIRSVTGRLVLCDFASCTFNV